MQVPGAIIFVNDNVTISTLNTLATDDSPNPSTVQGIDTQLQINETISFHEFNARVEADPNYPKVVHLNRLRILVILKDFQDTKNRHLADVVMFIKQGIASVEKCKYGPPGFSIDTQRLNIFNLLYGVRHGGSWSCFSCFPFPPPCPCPGFPPPICPPQTQTFENPRPPEHVRHHFPEGLGALELFGTEALETRFQGPQTGAFGGRINGDGNGGGDDGDDGGEGEV